MMPRYLSDSEPESQITSSNVSGELKLYQAFIFSVPIFFAFILLFMFYLFYLRRRRADWSSLRMRTSPGLELEQSLSMAELGLKKEVREMLPIIVYKETFSIRDNQCSVCLGDYQAEDKLQQIPACGHTFHLDCIDHWLAKNTTCPLCRLSVLASPKSPEKLPVIQAQESSPPVSCDGLAVQPVSQSCEETLGEQPLGQTVGDAGIPQGNCETQGEEPLGETVGDARIPQGNSDTQGEEPLGETVGDARIPQGNSDTQGEEPLGQTVGDTRIPQGNSDEQECGNQGRESTNTSNEANEHEGSRGISA